MMKTLTTLTAAATLVASQTKAMIAGIRGQITNDAIARINAPMAVPSVRFEPGYTGG